MNVRRGVFQHPVKANGSWHYLEITDFSSTHDPEDVHVGVTLQPNYESKAQTATEYYSIAAVITDLTDRGLAREPFQRGALCDSAAATGTGWTIKVRTLL